MLSVWTFQTVVNICMLLVFINADSQKDTFCALCTCSRGDGYIVCARGLPILSKIHNTERVQNLTLIVQSSYVFYYENRVDIDKLFDNVIVRGDRRVSPTSTDNQHPTRPTTPSNKEDISQGTPVYHTLPKTSTTVQALLPSTTVTKSDKHAESLGSGYKIPKIHRNISQLPVPAEPSHSTTQINQLDKRVHTKSVAVITVPYDSTTPVVPHVLATHFVKENTLKNTDLVRELLVEFGGSLLTIGLILISACSGFGIYKIYHHCKTPTRLSSSSLWHRSPIYRRPGPREQEVINLEDL